MYMCGGKDINLVDVHTFMSRRSCVENLNTFDQSNIESK